MLLWEFVPLISCALPFQKPEQVTLFSQPLAITVTIKIEVLLPRKAAPVPVPQPHSSVSFWGFISLFAWVVWKNTNKDVLSWVY